MRTSPRSPTCPSDSPLRPPYPPRPLNPRPPPPPPPPPPPLLPRAEHAATHVPPTRIRATVLDLSSFMLEKRFPKECKCTIIMARRCVFVCSVWYLPIDEHKNGPVLSDVNLCAFCVAE